MSSLWVDFAAIKGSVDIEQVLEHYRVRLKRVRKDYLRGLCPLPTHGSEQSRASFGVDTGRNVWACHSASCSQARHGKVGGNILDLVACMEACSIREAALRLRAWSDTSRETGLPDQLVSTVNRPIFGPHTTIAASEKRYSFPVEVFAVEGRAPYRAQILARSLPAQSPPWSRFSLSHFRPRITTSKPIGPRRAWKSFCVAVRFARKIPSSVMGAGANKPMMNIMIGSGFAAASATVAARRSPTCRPSLRPTAITA